MQKKSPEEDRTEIKSPSYKAAPDQTGFEVGFIRRCSIARKFISVRTFVSKWTKSS